MVYEREEFFKLDNLDRRIAFWLMDNDPKDLCAWTKEVGNNYARKRVIIDSNRLLNELMLEVSK